MTLYNPVILATTATAKKPAALDAVEKTLHDGMSKLLIMLVIFMVVEVIVSLAVWFFFFRIWPSQKRMKKEVMAIARFVGGALGVFIGLKFAGIW